MRPARPPFVDALRGFALLGVFGANVMIVSGPVVELRLIENRASSSSSSAGSSKAVAVP